MLSYKMVKHNLVLGAFILVVFVAAAYCDEISDADIKVIDVISASESDSPQLTRARRFGGRRRFGRFHENKTVGKRIKCI